jgi:hypothetical protein
VSVKSPVREFRTPGSVAGLVSNRQSYADAAICFGRESKGYYEGRGRKNQKNNKVMKT